MTRPVSRVLAAVLWCSLAAPAVVLAQPPVPAPAPAQPPPPPPPPPPQEGTAEFSFVGTTGNAPTSAIGLGVEYISRRPELWVFRAKANYVRNESEDELKAEAFRALFRATRTLTDRLSVFSEYGYLHDQFAGIDHRNTIDGGITFALVRPQPHQLDVDAGLGYAHESRVVGEDISTAQALLGSRYKYTLSDTAEITDDLAFAFSLSDSDDWRTSNAAALTVKIASIFSLKVSNIVRYVNAPAPGFETTDTLTSVALVAKF